MYMCVRGIDCVSVSVILGLGFGTVLTLLCVVCHFITLFDFTDVVVCCLSFHNAI